jgi:hypothetical protein
MSGPKYCLHCLERVDKFMRSATGGPSLPQCPKCQGYIPAIYDDQYDRYPPLFMTMIGQRAHGKTAYLASLLQQLHRVGREWHNFAFMPLDDRVLMSLDTYLEQLQSGQAFERTEAEAKEAIGVRLSGIPHLGNRHLLIYDVGGEVFDSTVDIQNTRGSTWFRNPVVVWFVSLTNLNEREYARDYELTGMLTRFAQALTEMGKSPTTKTILIVLTKADLLRTWPNMPQSINDLLDGQEDYTGPDCWARLERISRDAEQWLRQSGLHNFVNSLRQTFGAVQYCITSAFGVAPDDNGQRAFGAEPRGVLAPLFWLYRFYHGAKIRSGHATYYSLVDAIANNRGEPIVLREGIYEINEPLRIDRPLTIQGQGRDESWLMAKCPGPLITYTGRGQFEMSGVTLTNEQEHTCDLFSAQNGEVVLSNCTFEGAYVPQMPKELDRVGGVGLRLSGKVEATIRRCTIKANQSHGIVLRHQARAEISECEISHNVGIGVLCWDEVRGSVRANSITHNGQEGIRLARTASVEVLTNRIEHNRAGLVFATNAPCTIAGNFVLENEEYGVVCRVNGVAQQRLQAELPKNQCQANGQRDYIEIMPTNSPRPPQQ